jgi:putative acetyltransferase
MTTDPLAIVYKVADTPHAFEAGAHLFQQYAQAIGIDLSFQGFTRELESLTEQYGPPTGALLLAYHDEEAIGCVGIRALEGATAELKRMFVQPRYQGRKIGQELLQRILDIATNLGYKRVRLDTLSTMHGALHLYRQYGFYEIPPYYHNPIEGAVYMEKQLA